MENGNQSIVVDLFAAVRFHVKEAAAATSIIPVAQHIRAY